MPLLMARPLGFSITGRMHHIPSGQTQAAHTGYSLAKEATEGVKDNCHERFNIELEAKGFIDNWKDAYADIWRRAIRQGLDSGWKPKDMQLDIGKILIKADDKIEDEETVCKKLGLLDIKEEEPDE